MIIELIELYDLIKFHNFHFLIFHFIFFVLMANLLRRAWKRGNRPKKKNVRGRYGIVIPVKDEKISVFESVLNVLKETGIKDNVVVVYDGNNGKVYEKITKKYGFDFLRGNGNGKSDALIKGFEKIKDKTEFVLFLDSDTIITKYDIEDLLKGFYSKEIVGVMGFHLGYGLKKNVPYYFNEINEFSRNVVERGLAPYLSVVDGRAMMWRKEFIEKIKSEFLEMTKRECGDDAVLTYLAYKNGFKTNFVEESNSFVLAQPTTKMYLKQQIRWARTGYKFFPKYLKMKNVNLKNKIHQFFYFLEPFSFLSAIILDVFIFNTFPFKISVLYIPLFFFFGNWINHLLSQTILYDKPVNFGINSMIMSLLGVFVLFPIKIYSFLTRNNGHEWLTR